MQNNNTEEKQAAELIIANKELAFQNEEKEKRAAELILANKELAFQNEEKEKRAQELIIANKELAFQNEEKEKRAAELTVANKELAFQNEEKEKRAAELILANKELAFQNEEKEKRAAELIIANKELAFQNEEKEKRAAELINSEMRYRRLFESAKDGVLILDAETGMIDDVNPFLINLLGYSHEEFIGKKIWDIGFFKDIFASYENFLELQQNEYIRYEDLKLKTSEGKGINVEFVSNVYLVNNQKVIQCNVRDITERKKRDQQLVLFDTILKHLNRKNEWINLIKDILKEIKTFTGFDAVGIRLKEGEDYTYYAQSGFAEDFIRTENYLCTYDISGQILRESSGEPVLDCMCGNIICGRTDPSKEFFTEKGSFWTNSTTKLLASTTEEDRQARTRNRCNGEGYESVALIPITSGEKTIGLLQLNDKQTGRFTFDSIEFFEHVTSAIGIAFSRMQSENSIKESEEKYRNLIQTMPEGFYRSKPEGYFVDVNPALVKMLGYESKEELMKIYIPEELYFSKDDREVNVHNIDFTSDSEAYRLRKKDGSEIWVVDFGRYIKDDSGKVIFHEGIMRDVTESLHAQKAIIEAKDKAEEMSRLKSSFLANMSHEIRTPLNGILGFAQLLELEVKDDEQLKCVKVIEKSGNRLLETLDLILNFSKLEAEMVSAVYKELNVSNVIEEVVDNFEAMARIKKLVIEKKIKQKNLVTKIDDRFLRHVLNNLVKNAIVYTNKGGITVTFEKDEKDMIIKVKDTGIGIAKEYYEVIFEPFRQESEGLGRNFEGTGLGLSITKRFVELMNGNIVVESEVGVGSTFTVRLPFSDADATKEVKTKEKESAKKAPVDKTTEKKELSILLVENDEANREYTLAVLDKYYKTDFAIDGQDAIDAAKKKNYDIILMDINLGKKIDGIMATQEIRKMKGYKDTPIVALTAYVREGDEEEFLAGGCTHFLGKPFTVKQLLGLVEEIVQSKE